MKMKKNYLYAYSTTQRCPKEIINIFQIEDFFHIGEYLGEFSKKFETALMV